MMSAESAASFFNAVEDAKITILAVSDDLTVPVDDDLSLLEATNSLTMTCQALKAEAAKVAVLFGDQIPPATEAQSMADSLLKHTLPVFSTVRTCLSSSSVHVREPLTKKCKEVRSAVLCLFDGMLQANSRETQPKRLAVVAEHLRSKLDDLQTVPLDSLSAVKVIVAAAGMSVRDVLREMMELASEQNVHVSTSVSQVSQKLAQLTTVDSASCTDHRESTDHAACDPSSSETQHSRTHGSDHPPSRDDNRDSCDPSKAGHIDCSDSDDGMLDFEDEEMSAMEQRRLQGAVLVLQRCFKLVHAVMAKLIQGVAEDQANSKLDQIGSSISVIQKAADTLGAAVYPPQEESDFCCAWDTMLENVTKIHNLDIQEGQDIHAACLALIRLQRSCFETIRL